GKRGEEAKKHAHADHGALRPEELHADRIHAYGTMDRRAAMRFGDDQRMGGTQKRLPLGRECAEIAQAAEQHIGRIAHDAEAGGNPAAALIEAIIAAAEEGEIIVIEPGKEIERFGELALGQWWPRALERRARFRQRI